MPGIQILEELAAVLAESWQEPGWLWKRVDSGGPPGGPDRAIGSARTLYRLRNFRRDPAQAGMMNSGTSSRQQGPRAPIFQVADWDCGRPPRSRPEMIEQFKKGNCPEEIDNEVNAEQLIRKTMANFVDTELVPKLKRSMKRRVSHGSIPGDGPDGVFGIRYPKDKGDPAETRRCIASSVRSLPEGW